MKNITGSGTFARITKYTLVRASVLFVTVVVAVYLIIFIANLGGFVDTIISSDIELALMGMVRGGWLQGVPTEEKFEIIRQTKWEMEEAAGLHEPFVLRCLRWLGRGLTFNWGKSNTSSSMWNQEVKDVRLIILDNLPRTLLLFGTANLFLFFTSIFLALPLTKRYGSRLDRLIIALSPLSAVPSWVYGIVLNLISLKLLGGFFAGGTFDAWPDDFKLAYLPLILKHMVLPFLAIFLSGLFQSAYAWRTFFLIYSSEDHVEMARAKGLPDSMIERRYILRPILPNLITSFALLFVSLWQEVIALEYFFNVAGIGRLFIRALNIHRPDMPVVVALVVTFAYILALTVFILDIVYALVDPRVTVGGKRHTARAVSRKKSRFRPWAPRGPGRAPKPAWEARSDFADFTSPRAQASFSDRIAGLRKGMGNLKSTLREMARYPSALVGLVIIALLIGISIYAVITIPYEEAIRLWRGDEKVWERVPRQALPTWINFFRKDDLPSTMILNSQHEHDAPGVVSKHATPFAEGMAEITISFAFDFAYRTFPQDLTVYLEARYDEKKPLLTLTWLTPDEREIDLGTFSIQHSHVYYVTQEERLQRRLETRHLEQALFADPNAETPVPLPGRYELQVSALVFEEDADLEAEVVLYGQVYGLAGTDRSRRDLMVALLWGTLVALAFGLLAAVGTSLSSMAIAAVGAWFGGWVDGLIQRVTEVNMILPFFPVSLMIYILYSKSFLAILGVTVLLSIFGNAIKNYRAIFLQMKQAPYIEAAQAYGAGNWRIIFRYLVPRIIAVLVPQLVILVPSYVFLEATLAYLGVSDPVLPTWGKLIAGGLSAGLYRGTYHVVLAPISLLMLLGFAFVMVGLTLERIFEPRLREM